MGGGIKRDLHGVLRNVRECAGHGREGMVDGLLKG